MATFEQALEKAFEITWTHGKELDEARASIKDERDEHMRDLLMASVEQTFVGSVDILGSLLHMAGRIPVFATSSYDNTAGWADGSTATLLALMVWARDNGTITGAEYQDWMEVQNA